VAVQFDVANSPLLLTVLPILLTACLTGVGILVKDWREERNQSVRFKETLDRAIREVEFLTKWNETSQPLLSAQEREQSISELKHNLERIRRRVVTESDIDSEQRTKGKSRSVARRVLLIGDANTWMAKVLRWCYWLYGVIILFIVVPIALTSRRPEDNLLETLALNTLTFAIFTLPLFALWRFTRMLSVYRKR
jgi:hypothetical protein